MSSATSVRSPFVVHWPASLDASLAGSVVDAPAHLIDVLPTLAAAAGANDPEQRGDAWIQPLEGVDLFPALAGHALERKRPLGFEHRSNQALRDDGDRLEIFGFDLRHTPSVEAFCAHLSATRNRLDYIISNAGQTVRRPPDVYKHMMDREAGALADLSKPAQELLGEYEGLRGYALLPEGKAPLAGLTDSAELSQAALLPEERGAQSQLFPEGQLDQDSQQVDMRERNSWRLMLAEVSSLELLETQLVNAVAPFVLNARLRGLMTSTAERDKHIANVSAVEGQFYRKFKTTRHPHTNMAKALHNMMTRTSAAEYHADGIHMNAVDTGWVTDEDPVHIAEQNVREQGFHPPLDIVDPIIARANTGDHVWGNFLKDYTETDW